MGLLPRAGTADEVIWCDVAPCYVFHPCNGYETDDGKVKRRFSMTLYVDRCAHCAQCEEVCPAKPDKAVTLNDFFEEAAFDRGASIFRVHDVRPHVEALALAAAVERGALA